MPSIPRRAAPLPPEERRAALVASTLPLVLSHGREVSTRQIAHAAGVAEGTIFRVFASKDELVDAAIASAFDVGALLRELSRVDMALPLRLRLHTVVEILQRWWRRIGRLLDTLGTTRLELRRGKRDFQVHSAVVDTVAEVIRPDRGELRSEPAQAAQWLWLMAFAASHPRLVGEQSLPPEEIVSILLDGIQRAPTEDPTEDPDPTGEAIAEPDVGPPAAHSPDVPLTGDHTC